MTTLSKEDVVLLMEKSKFRSWIRGEGPSNEGFFMNFATIARADLVAENERLKATPPDQRQDLHCVVSDIAAECRELHDQLTAARTALAAAEARESATRAILDQVMDDIRSEAFLFDGGNGISADTEDAADNLLDQPRDDSALREMIAGVYDECAKLSDSYAYMSQGFVALSEELRAQAEKAKGE